MTWSWAWVSNILYGWSWLARLFTTFKYWHFRFTNLDLWCKNKATHISANETSFQSAYQLGLDTPQDASPHSCEGANSREARRALRWTHPRQRARCAPHNACRRQLWRSLRFVHPHAGSHHQSRWTISNLPIQKRNNRSSTHYCASSVRHARSFLAALTWARKTMVVHFLGQRERNDGAKLVDFRKVISAVWR